VASTSESVESLRAAAEEATSLSKVRLQLATLIQTELARPDLSEDDPDMRALTAGTENALLRALNQVQACRERLRGVRLEVERTAPVHAAGSCARVAGGGHTVHDVFGGSWTRPSTWSMQDLWRRALPRVHDEVPLARTRVFRGTRARGDREVGSMSVFS